MKTLVIGLGNPILTDDGVGIYAARRVEELLPQGSNIEVIEASIGGIALMEQMVGYQRVILIDALWTPIEEVGRVQVFDAGDLTETLNTRSTHDADLPTALRMGRELGASLPETHQIQIVAITANQVLDFCDRPTPAVEGAIPVACEAVLDLLGCPASRIV